MGRDEFVATLWEQLENQSVALFSPRRVGKTSVLRRLEKQAPAGWRVLLRDLEGLDSAEEFTYRIYEDAAALMPGTKGYLATTRAWLNKVAGSVELKDVKITLGQNAWSGLLERVFADLSSHLEARDERLVLLWDEFTLFVGDVSSRGTAANAMKILDVLRAARQKHPRIRLVLTGSVGIHLVLRELTKAGYANRGINDMRLQSVPMLTASAREELARALLAGIGQEADTAVVEAISRCSEGHPFVLQHLVDRLRGRARVDVDAVEQVLADLLEPPSVLDLGHYADRIRRYYADLAEPALAVLDCVATGAAVRLDDLEAASGTSRGQLVDVLRDLRNDEYLEMTGEQARFKLEFVRRHWVKDRFLA